MEYILAIAGIIIGGIAGYAIAHFKSKSESSRLEERNQNLSDQLQEAEAELDSLQQKKEEELEQERKRANELDKQLAERNADYRNLQERLSEQKKELGEMQEQLTTQFENLANKILEEKSEKFTKQNKEQMDQLLNPLGEKLEAFKKKVEETYDDENRQRATLKEQIKQMAELNKTMSEDAKNLTKALKGDSKTQGNWGEVILQRILEKSGLRKDEEYFVEQSVTMDDGRRIRPDVVVRLPDEKFLVIDSKVSLTAYEQFSSAEDEADQERALKEHINSIRTHVKGLSEKNYQHIHGDRSPDFVLLFIPIEPAFGAALQHDSNLYYEAFDKNIVIVSPSTLLATLATIDSVWKQEYQNKNAMEIAKRGGALYDKFVLFVESMNDIGQRIRQTQDSYDEAMGRLSTGAGNLVRQAEMIRKLGAKTSKQLPDGMEEDQELIED
ncbi:MAG: DNA recombination protein RmuC [Balneola sp.]|jgi:DNA recombination protein RmuC|nr:DNA recombination protein RmuC [Balneola sp.]MBE79276.1 DNA recombination protein RmuC [Balneola sp.]|tara:strand:+ start:84771 stop:86093 length:1323 start_codon:yes stop_codon:yes gene_type:complete